MDEGTSGTDESSSDEECQQTALINSLSIIAASLVLVVKKRKRYKKKRKCLQRPYKRALLIFQEEYFVGKYMSFESTFSISESLFKTITNKLLQQDYNFWKQSRNAAGRDGIPTQTKVIAALRIITSGCAAQKAISGLCICVQSCRTFYIKFIHDLRLSFPDVIKFPSTTNEISAVIEANEKKHDLPGYLGAIDCTHIHWEACPVAFKGSYKSRYPYQTVILEAVVDAKKKFIHASAGCPGSMNDISVLRSGLIYQLLVENKFPEYEYNLGGFPRKHPFLFGDGIYPRWGMFAKPFHYPQTEAEKIYTKRQESIRKDVECAFGHLKKRFQILNNGIRLRQTKDVTCLIYSCCILHNLRADELAARGAEFEENDFEENVLDDQIETEPQIQDQTSSEADSPTWWWNELASHVSLTDGLKMHFASS